MAKISELKPIFNMSTEEYNQPGEMLKFLMARAKMSRSELHSKLNAQKAGQGKFISSPSQISDFMKDKVDKDDGKVFKRTIPLQYLAQLIKCFGMKKKEEGYYIKEFLRSSLPEALSDYVRAPIATDISKNMAMAHIAKDYRELSIKHREQTESLEQLKSNLADWRNEAYSLADVLDSKNSRSTREPNELVEIERSTAYKAFNYGSSYKQSLREWEHLKFSDHPVDLELQAIKEDEDYEDHYKNLYVEKELVAELLNTSANEIANSASNQSIKTMINSFFNQSQQSDGLMKSWYPSSINGFTKTKQTYIINDTYLKQQSFMRPLSAILCSIHIEWRSALKTDKSYDLSIESTIFQEYCCDLFSDYEKYFPALSSWLSPFGAADPKTAYDLLKNDYLIERALYERNFGAALKAFEDFMLESHPICTYFGMPVCTVLSFGSFAANSVVFTHGPTIKYHGNKIQNELDHSQQNFSFAWLYTKREHEHSAPDAGIHLAKLMNGLFDIEQAKEVSVSILDELSTAPAKESYIAHLNGLFAFFFKKPFSL